MKMQRESVGCPGGLAHWRKPIKSQIWQRLTLRQTIAPNGAMAQRCSTQANGPPDLTMEIVSPESVASNGKYLEIRPKKGELPTDCSKTLWGRFLTCRGNGRLETCPTF